MKQKTVVQLKREADKWWSLATRYRFMDNGLVECVTCHVLLQPKSIQCGHFQSRRFNNTRFDERNTAPQCSACNVFRYGEQFKFGRFIDEFYGPGTAQELEKEARIPHKFTRQELEEIIQDCKTQVKFYESL